MKSHYAHYEFTYGFTEIMLKKLVCLEEESRLKSSQDYCPSPLLEDPVPTNSSLKKRPTVLPRRMVLTGFMGAGKSTLGARVAKELGWRFVDLDEEIVRAEQQSIADIFDTVGEVRFRELESIALAAMLKESGVVLALGGGALETEANRRLLAGDPATLLVYLAAPLDILIARCERQARSQPQAARRPVLEKREVLRERFLKRKPLYELAHWTIETAEQEPDQIVQTVLIRWNEHAQGASFAHNE